MYFCARLKSGSRMFSYLCLIRDARIAVSILLSSHIRCHNCAVFPYRFIMSPSFYSVNFRMVLLINLWTDMFCRFGYYRQSCARYILLRISEDANPLTLFALFALFALLARPTPTNGAFARTTFLLYALRITL